MERRANKWTGRKKVPEHIHTTVTVLQALNTVPLCAFHRPRAYSLGMMTVVQ